MLDELGGDADRDRDRRPGRRDRAALRAVDEVDPYLTLKGLRLIHERN